MNSYKDPYYKVIVSVKLNRPKRWYGKDQLTFSFEYYVNSNIKLKRVISGAHNKTNDELKGQYMYEITSISVIGHGAE